MGTHFWDDMTIVDELGDYSRVPDMRMNLIVGKLITHIFGNYVLQKVLNIVDPQLKDQILMQVKTFQGKL